MTPNDIAAIVERELATWKPPIVEPGTTVGVPWPADQYAAEIERLRAALVTPYPQHFELREQDALNDGRVHGEAVYWVVATTEQMYLWYDENTEEFGVGEPAAEGALPISIGLRGDIIGSFCAW